ncbi:MAG: ROK family protein [Treponema sp.]|nr:ROK family protein [Treponema sp.]
MNNVGMGLIRKRNTRNRILGIIRSSVKISKVAIKNQTQYSMITVLNTIDELIGEGLIHYAEKPKTSNGRRPTYISLTPDGGYFLGVSFNAADISSALLDYSGKTVDYYCLSIPPDELSVEYVIEKVKETIHLMLSRHADIQDKLYGIGIGAPGYIDEKNGLSIFYPHIPGWKDIPLLDILQEDNPGKKLYFEHNTNAMTLAYKWLRPQYRDLNYVIISIRSGVRMSYIINGSLYRGKSSTTGEIGHISVNNGSRLCPCGKRGCLDTEISETAIKQKIIEWINVGRFQEMWKSVGCDQNKVGVELLVEYAKKGDSDSLALLSEIYQYLGLSIAQILNILNPNCIIISSKLCGLGDQLTSGLMNVVSEHAIFVTLQDFTITNTEFGSTLAAVGAAAIVMEHELDFVEMTI